MKNSTISNQLSSLLAGTNWTQWKPSNVNDDYKIEEKEPEYENIKIRLTENGFVVTADEKQFVFTSIKALRKWTEKYLSIPFRDKEFLETL